MTKPTNYRDVLKDENSLAKFLKAMSKFDRLFTDLMVDSSDFTLTLEIHGNKGEMIHARVKFDNFERPNGVEQRVERAKKY
ncbi:hypothetical protein M0R72_14265 [Candidatus Pacearchaeota archaeon]|jgi:hypothetical protein|nr:hypothetical protein [Candidatus Pacearchaeota archaeon]